jgi:hypothetical protein
MDSTEGTDSISQIAVNSRWLSLLVKTQIRKNSDTMYQTGYCSSDTLDLG